MSSFQIAPLETIAAEGLTGLFISAGAKGDSAKIVSRANATLKIATAVQQVAGGNTQAGLTALASALSTADLDPGEALALQGVLSQLGTQAALLNNFLGGTLAGQLAATVFTNVTTGVVNACQAEITKSSAPSAPSTGG